MSTDKLLKGQNGLNFRDKSEHYVR